MPCPASRHLRWSHAPVQLRAILPAEIVCPNVGVCHRIEDYGTENARRPLEVPVTVLWGQLLRQARLYQVVVLDGNKDVVLLEVV